MKGLLGKENQEKCGKKKIKRKSKKNEDLFSWVLEGKKNEEKKLTRKGEVEGNK